jgi:hypothetical protein
MALLDSHSHFLTMLPKELSQDWIEMKHNMTAVLSKELVISFKPTAYTILLQSTSKAGLPLYKRSMPKNNIDSTANRLSDAWQIHVDKTLPTVLKFQIKDWKHRRMINNHRHHKYAFCILFL